MPRWDTGKELLAHILSIQTLHGQIPNFSTETLQSVIASETLNMHETPQGHFICPIQKFLLRNHPPDHPHITLLKAPPSCKIVSFGSSGLICRSCHSQVSGTGILGIARLSCGGGTFALGCVFSVVPRSSAFVPFSETRDKIHAGEMAELDVLSCKRSPASLASRILSRAKCCAPAVFFLCPKFRKNSLHYVSGTQKRLPIVLLRTRGLLNSRQNPCR